MMPEIPEEVRAIKARIAAFVREELHPFEAEIAERGRIDEGKLSALRAKARTAATMQSSCRAGDAGAHSGPKSRNSWSAHPARMPSAGSVMRLDCFMMSRLRRAKATGSCPGA